MTHPDIDPNNLTGQAERIKKAERIWDLLLDNLTQLFEGNIISARKITHDEDGNETVEEIYQQVTAADRAAVIRLMMQNGVRLDPALLPKTLRDAMRRPLSDPAEDVREEDVA